MTKIAEYFNEQLAFEMGLLRM